MSSQQEFYNASNTMDQNSFYAVNNPPSLSSQRLKDYPWPSPTFKTVPGITQTSPTVPSAPPQALKPTITSAKRDNVSSNFTEESGVKSAAGILASTNLAGSVVGGVASIGKTLINNANQRGMQDKQLAMDNKVLDFNKSQLDFSKQQWNREYDVANSMGLASPAQIGNPLSGGHGALMGKTFRNIPSSPFQNQWS